MPLPLDSLGWVGISGAVTLAAVKVALLTLFAMAITFAVGFFVLPHGIGWSIAAVAFTALCLSIVLPRFFNGGDGK